MNWVFLVLVVFGFSSISFYVAVNNYIIDQKDHYLISKDKNVYNQAKANTLLAETIQNNMTLQKNILDSLTTECHRIRNQSIDFEESENYLRMYDEMYGNITQASNACNEKIDILNKTLYQMINGTNATANTLGQGICQFSSEIDSTTVSYRYQRLYLNGVDFYYYIFDQSISPISFNSSDISIHSCSPIIFIGPTVKKAYRFGILGYPVDYLNVGSEKVEIIPTLGSFVNQTMELNGFQLWMGLF